MTKIALTLLRGVVMRREMSDRELEAKSRPSVITLSVLTLRLIENWREMVSEASRPATDIDCAIIFVAVIAIGAEKFTRIDLEPELQNLSDAMPPGRLNKCNLSSISAATGINRETVRRKVNSLVKRGLLQHDELDGIRVTPTFAGREGVRSIVQAQVDALGRATAKLSSLGVLGRRE